MLDHSSRLRQPIPPVTAQVRPHEVHTPVGEMPRSSARSSMTMCAHSVRALQHPEPAGAGGARGEVGSRAGSHGVGLLPGWAKDASGAHDQRACTDRVREDDVPQCDPPPLPDCARTLLDARLDDAVAIRDLLQPFPSELIRAYPVSARVNNLKNDAADLLDTIEA